jgi:hypothetical protein
MKSIKKYINSNALIDDDYGIDVAFPQFSRHSIMSKLDWSERNEENEIHA